MTTVALVNPTTLLGKELRENLERRRDLWTDIRLLSGEEEEIGTLTEIGGAAAIVSRADLDDLAAARLVFFCGSRESSLPLLAELLAAATAIVLAADATSEDGVPLVAGVNLDDGLVGAEPGRPLLSPHPGALMLVYLLHPLR